MRTIELLREKLAWIKDDVRYKAPEQLPQSMLHYLDLLASIIEQAPCAGASAIEVESPQREARGLGTESATAVIRRDAQEHHSSVKGIGVEEIRLVVYQWLVENMEDSDETVEGVMAEIGKNPRATKADADLRARLTALLSPDKADGQPPRYFTQEEVKAIAERISACASFIQVTPIREALKEAIKVVCEQEGIKLD